MTPLETVLTAWIAFHAELGVDMEAYLMPPATETQIIAVEEQIGYRLPEDLRELYKIANGQLSMFDDDISLSDAGSGQRWAPMFGHYDFLPLEKALQQYEFYLEMYTSDKEFTTKYYQANPDKTYEPIVWEVREGDSVDEAGWNPKWFTFAGSDANYYSVDMDPPHGGAPGQVVLHGADEHVLQVVGQSVTDMMEQAITHISVDDEHRFQFEEGDGSYMASVFFEMDWRAELYIPHEAMEAPAAYTAWMEEQERSTELYKEQLNVWLQGQNLSAEDHDSALQWLSERFVRSVEMMSPPMSVVMEMQMQRMSEGELPNMGEMVEGVTSLMSHDGQKQQMHQHAFSVAGAYFDTFSPQLDIGASLTNMEKINLYHQYKLEMGEWTQSDFDNMKKFLAELQKVQIDTEGGFFMSSGPDALTLCTSTFDEESYKSDEICHAFYVKNVRLGC